jgi:hypothetical protein
VICIYLRYSNQERVIGSDLHIGANAHVPLSLPSAPPQTPHFFNKHTSTSLTSWPPEPKRSKYPTCIGSVSTPFASSLSTSKKTAKTARFPRSSAERRVSYGCGPKMSERIVATAPSRLTTNCAKRRALGPM